MTGFAPLVPPLLTSECVEPRNQSVSQRRACIMVK